MPVAETLKRIDGDRVGATVDRSGLGAAQTPQGVRRDLLREAYRRFPADGAETLTDEAALLEACSIPVHVVPGDPDNLKVTLPADLRRAADGARPARAPARTGIGHDSHPFGPGDAARLGGVEIAARPAAGRPLGRRRRAPRRGRRAARGGRAGRPRPPLPGRRADAGAASPAATLLQEVRRQLEDHGWRPRAVDLTIIAARPRLGRHLDAMRAAIAALLGLDAAAVNVKASSGNLDGAEGAGRSISALAIATVEPLR